MTSPEKMHETQPVRCLKRDIYSPVFIAYRISTSINESVLLEVDEVLAQTSNTHAGGTNLLTPVRLRCSEKMRAAVRIVSASVQIPTPAEFIH